jgi:hypothetical protein
MGLNDETETETQTEKENIMSTNPVDAAIAAAQEKAENAEPVATTQAVAPAQPTAVAAAPVGGPLTFDDLTQGGMDVTDWLKVNEFGLTVGSHGDKLFKDAEFLIDTNNVQAVEVIKFGNPATYMKTYDRITCVSGGTWQEAMAKAAQVQPGVRPYQSAELPLQVVSDIEVDGTVVAQEGDLLGHSTSTTNFANLSSLMKELKEKGQSPIPGERKGAIVKLKVSSEKRTNQRKNTWGVLAFELLEVVEPAEAL